MPAMNPTARWFVVLGALSAAASVAIGAAAAHVHDPELAARLPLVDTALRYHQLHAIGLIVAGLLARDGAGRWLIAAGALFVAGTLLFSVNLYLRAFAGFDALRGWVPLGGGAFIVGWIALAVAAWRTRTSPPR